MTGFWGSAIVVGDRGVRPAPTNMPALADGRWWPRPPGPVRSRCFGPAPSVAERRRGRNWPLPLGERRARLCLGRQARCCCGRPYIRVCTMICASTPQSRVMRSGPTFEYLFGEERGAAAGGGHDPQPWRCRDRRGPVGCFITYVRCITPVWRLGRLRRGNARFWPILAAWRCPSSHQPGRDGPGAVPAGAGPGRGARALVAGLGPGASRPCPERSVVRKGVHLHNDDGVFRRGPVHQGLPRRPDLSPVPQRRRVAVAADVEGWQ